MNMLSTRAQSENQQRLFDALRRISEDNNQGANLRVSSHSMPDHSALFSEDHLLSASDFVSSISTGDDSDTAGFTLDFTDNSEATLSYDPISSVANEQPLQVDRNGSKVGENSSASSVLPVSLLSDLTRSMSVSTCSSVQCSPKLPASATVFAAAVTAAMIVDRHEGVSKRPRSPSPESVDEDYMGDDDTDGQNADDPDDDSTDTSSDDLEDVYDERAESSEPRGSPRSVLHLSRPPLEVPSSVRQNGSFGYQISRSVLRGSLPGPVVAPQSRTVTNHSESAAHTSQLRRGAAYVPVDIESSRNASLCRKRRAEAMERFRRKKAVRCYGRRVRYQIRKRIATTRPRVNGRFARRVDIEPKGHSTKDN